MIWTYRADDMGITCCATLTRAIAQTYIVYNEKNVFKESRNE